MARENKPIRLSPNILRLLVIICAGACVFFTYTAACYGVYGLDIIADVIESPVFEGKTAHEKLKLLVELTRGQTLNQSDMSYVALDWADQYLRIPNDPLERLKKWAQIAEDEQLSKLRLPRDFLNRTLLAEYLVKNREYLNSSPKKKLQLLAELSKDNLVDWSVALAYARIYAGAVILGAESKKAPTPWEALNTLKRIKEKGLVGWHYRAPTEAILCSEVLAMDQSYISSKPLDRLKRLKALQNEGLITALTRKELEKLPVWRLLVNDEDFLQSDATAKRAHLIELKNSGLILASTYSDLEKIFLKESPDQDQPAELNPLPPDIQNR